MTRREPWTFDEVALRFSYKAARHLAPKYRLDGIDLDDIAAVIRVWIYGEGRPRVERWLGNDPQQTTRVYRTMLDVGLKWAEQEKAQKLGYKVDDLFWYSPAVIDNVMPYVLDPTFTETSGKLGELIATVVDVRRVLTPDLRAYFGAHEPGDIGWADKVAELINRLGGTDRPRVRRAMSNAESQAITEAGY